MRIELEQQVLLHLIKESIQSNAAPMPEQWLQQVDWDAVFEEACSQTVVLQTYDTAGAYKQWIPEETYQRWFLTATKIMRRNMQVQMAQNDLVKLLDGHGLSHVILKGTSSAQYYPRPELRVLGDIDFLIVPEQEAQVRSCLEQAGYKTKGKDVDHHAVYDRGSVPHEMHFQPAGVPEGEVGMRFSQALADIWKQVRLVSCDLAAFAAPSSMHHGVIILLHMLHHMLGGGFGLRHLCDWAVFVQSTKNADFWQDELVPLMERCGVLRYAFVMTRICADQLGTEIPDWCKAVEDDLAAEVLLDMLSGGNFGRKERDRDREGYIVSMELSENKDVGPVRNALAVLHHSTPSEYPIVRKYPVLHLFFDLYRGMRYIVRCLIGRRRWITTMLPKARARQSVYERMRIYETE